ncbi:putative outer membrane multidrug efflux lipoprotein, OMF family [Novosphingobium nitrogenifigens DSM 19370]|uniref:Putative outer membrane multidrug efflux lipoprotein, OMF family n=1 Tax=Novosphingobium nitrogenifigens DSM 19370 TaxID=983920 RepID=F1ZBS2_9SPHN|nr:efflux transporter outer membrane subunit [Novosphingobium nitrogenifigens]EGD58002.1 putative outer membrane multidrug efflux lipoprotein, OMF family [Novosphingobium nitrogenifigens DSM 19370]
MRRASLALLGLATTLAGCNMAPHYVRPESAAPPQWPQGAAYGPEQAGAAGLPWRTLFTDPRLQHVIELALANNRDLRASLASVASARAQYHVERSYQLPTISGGANASITRGIKTDQLDSSTYSGTVGMSSFEIDLFGRLKNQTRAAFESYLASQSGYRSARLTLVAETATAYATLASDRDLLSIAQSTLASGTRSLELTQELFRSGLTSAGDVQSAITVVEQARSDIANQTTLVAQDRNALELLVGAPVADDLLPASLSELDGTIGHVPAGVSSDILLQRPDVLQAEHQLQGANASIGEARAAFFPTIKLTSAVGLASSALSSLFTGGALNWNVTPSASVPILGGVTKGNLQYAKAQRDYYLAQYEKTVQSAFRDVADSLARRGTIVDQRGAQARLVAASEKAYTLADEQYRAGTGTFLTALVDQRSLYTARQTQVSTILTDISNRITLYNVLGADPSLDATPTNPPHS